MRRRRCTAPEVSPLFAQCLANQAREIQHSTGVQPVLRIVGRHSPQGLDAFSQRLQNDYALEFETALVEIHKIARLRLEALENGYRDLLRRLLGRRRIGAGALQQQQVAATSRPGRAHRAGGFCLLSGLRGADRAGAEPVCQTHRQRLGL